jgi:alpha-mannosidase
VEDRNDLDRRLAESLAQRTEQFTKLVPRQSAAPTDAYLVVNPLSFPRRVGLDVTQLKSLPRTDDSVRAVQEMPGKKLAVVEVPAMGFCWVGGGAAAVAAKSKGKAPPPMAEGTTLRNEHIEIVIHPDTGGIRAVHVPGYRGNRFSQQLAFRLPTPPPRPGDVWRDADEEAEYTTMAAEAVEITSAGPALGEIVSRGRLVDQEGKPLAGFSQRVQLWRESQVALLDIELDVAEEPRADPWSSYYAARFAWSDPSAEVWRSVSSCSQRTEGKRLEAPHFIEVREEQARTAVLTGGLPYHRRMGMRMLDTLLVVRGERARKFRLGIGVDLAHPLQAALELLTPVTAIAEQSAPPSPVAAGWLFHVDAKNVVATHWEPLVEPDRVAGFRVRLLETEGRAGRVTLRAYRPVARARQTDFLGQTLADLPVDNDRIRLDCTAHEWVQIEARWNPPGP